MTAPQSETGATPPEWPAALRQVFTEPWRVRPAYQPIIDLERGRLWGFQVLARFIGPRRATPLEWLDAAAEIGLRQALELRLLHAGLDAVSTLPERCRLLLPMSPDTLIAKATQKEIVRQVRVVRHLVLDLTPGGAPVDVEELAVAAEPLRADGGGIALSAGASPGGLGALPLLRPEILKLGREHVAGAGEDPERGAIIESLGELVGTIRGRLLGVGIESRPQLDALTAAGVTLGQGFGLGRPVPSMAAGILRPGAPLLNH